MNDLEGRAAEIVCRAHDIENIGFLDRMRAAQVLRTDTKTLLADMLTHIRQLEGLAHG